MALLQALTRVARAARHSTYTCSSGLLGFTAVPSAGLSIGLQASGHQQSACTLSGYCTGSYAAASWHCRAQRAPSSHPWRPQHWHSSASCSTSATSKTCRSSSIASTSSAFSHCSSGSSSVARYSTATCHSAAAQQQHAQEYDSYHVVVFTGNLRGAGSQHGAWVQLVGSTGESEKFPIGNSAEEGFARGSKVAFDVHVPRDIGDLRRILVERERGGSGDTGRGWYLDHIEVEGASTGRLVFPCHSWFGPSDCGDFVGALERNLIPAVADTRQLGMDGAVPAPEVEVSASAIAFPHPDKVRHGGMKGYNARYFGYGGEDAYFYCTGKNSIFGCGVADGVYAWKHQGIDSGALSRTLMETAQHMVMAGYEDVYRVLQVAARHVESEGMQGSCTVCLLTINKAVGRLHAANLGDSGFFLLGVRPGESKVGVKFRTSQMEHEFGRPFQLGHHAHASKPRDADLVTFPVIKGDTVVMGTDGLLDNLSETEILAEVTRLRSAGARPSQVVQSLARLAFESSVDRTKVTPYAKAATEAFDMVYRGGKKDDITILVAYIE